MVINDLNEIQVRILGCLLEKALSTPEYYPLSLNALTNACNQKSSRDPVLSLDEATVEEQVEILCRKDLAHQSTVGRVPKYEELFSKAHNFVPRESSVLCLLLLRGPQTVGEIRSRSTRLFAFESLEQVQETLAALEEWGLVRRLARRPGHKEVRYAHLLSPTAEVEADDERDAPQAPEQDVASAFGQEERLLKMESEIERLKGELETLKKAFDVFRQQFD